ncbi:unnamed protein product [Rotaria sordida]|uniref:Transposase domain-containing protein n=2 Tax=Rotaria sordida TaxID=392033 RepID=A0A819FHF0_9BILA|nr:unnamed protein product [Rotaria sordida]
MNDGTEENFVRSIFNDALKTLQPSSRSIRQKRWRTNRKNKPYSPHSNISYPADEQVEDTVSCTSFIDNTWLNDEQVNEDDDDDDDDRFVGSNAFLLYLDELNIYKETDEPLYLDSTITFKQYHKKIIEFGNFAKLSNTNMNKLLKLIAEGLPQDHKLVKSYSKLAEIFQEQSSFEDTTRCTECLQLINEKNKCSIFCQQNGIQRQVGNVIEHVFINKSNQQLVRIIRRNKELIINYPQVSNQILPCDIISRTIYQIKKEKLQTILNDAYPVTLMIHIDGTPICHWTRKHTWVVMGSIIEIPPPLRENQTNMILLGIWNAPVKPDPDILLVQLCDSIRQVIIIDGIKYKIDVQLFKSDLPARALACKHINHNGYYACLECDQKGIWCSEARTVIYPYHQNQVNLRTPAHFDICTEILRQQPSNKDFFGVKGTSPLAKILDIPTQIDLDIMHLCFLGHCSLLLDWWNELVVAQAWLSGNDFLTQIKWPHNFNVQLNSFSDRTYWKAHDYRAFFLYLMFPLAFSMLPENISSHFSLYFVFIRTLYFYHDFNEVVEVDPLIKLYCEYASKIYGSSFEIYSTHAHLHLTEKVSIDTSPFSVRDPRLNNDHHILNESLSTITNSAINQESSQVFQESPAKRRRSTANSVSMTSSAPPPRKRFNPVLQSTGASQLSNTIGTTASFISRTPITSSKSVPETTQYVLALAQTIKPLTKLCEEMNQLIKQVIAQNEQQMRLLSELVNAPRELDKLTHELSYILHLQAKMLQTRQYENDENLVTVIFKLKTLNGVDLSKVPRSATINATARALMRAAYGELACFNDLKDGEFNVLLGLIAHIHGQHISSVFVDSNSIKNSLQQMKHDTNKKSPLRKLKKSILKARKSTTAQERLARNDEDEEQQPHLKLLLPLSELVFFLMF